MDGSGVQFTPDDAYIVSNRFDFDGDTSIYRVSDGYHYPNVEPLHIPAGLLASGGTVIIIDPDQPTG